jgi:hypothetical protein
MAIILTRELHLTNPLLHGSDVGEVQALLTAKSFPVVIDQWFGPETAAACVTAKRKLGYPKADQVPTCGQPLVDKLEAHFPFPPPPISAARVRYLNTLRQALAQRGNWRYSQTRPIPHNINGIVVTDCSGGVTVCAEVAQCPDPNKRRFDGEGFTGTLLSACEHITLPMLRPCDLVVFGSYPGHHVCAVLAVEPVVLLWSHGHPGDPEEVSLQAMAASQAASGHSAVTYLRFIP